MTREQFVDHIGGLIQKEAWQRGYLYPSAVIAQACLESAYGTSQLSAKYHNFFGLKCGSAWRGASVNLKTGEFIAGRNIVIRDNFRAFPDDESGVQGYFDFISTPRYAPLKEATGPEDYLNKIKAAGYATAPNYVPANMAVVNKYNLTRFDHKYLNPVIGVGVL